MPTGPNASKYFAIATNQMKKKGCKHFGKGSKCRVHMGQRAEQIAASDKKKRY